MDFKFRFLCELLQDLDNSRLDKRASISRRIDPDRKVIKQWFTRRDGQIPRSGNEAVAFLSCLFPQRRVDRIYEIQESRLSSIIGRCLGLGITRLNQLNQWKEGGGMDLASCVESVMRDAENPTVLPLQEVTLDEIDGSMEQIASANRSSSPDVRRKQAGIVDVYKLLSDIFLRLRSWEAKWFVRLVLKKFDPVVLPETYTMLQFHFLLPEILRVQSSFEKAVSKLEEVQELGIPNSCLKEEVKTYMITAADQLAPEVGVYVKRPSYAKARSIKHCCNLAALRRISLERKYDGEYCQVHIDTLEGAQRIKLFSKSGKDSTKDRAGVHDALKRSLRLYQPGCLIKSRCILEGELLVWNDKKRCIQPFHKIRKHVSRSGRYIGTEQDSMLACQFRSASQRLTFLRPDPDERLMIMFFDILLFDDVVCLYRPHNARRTLLRDLVFKIPGLADIGTREIIDFSARKAEERLRHAFAKAITDRWEGFVLKGCSDPYFPAYGLIENGSACCIKLKKDYFAGMGDTVDFVVLGARYDARDAHILRDADRCNIRYTSFHVACLENKQQVKKLREKPRFRVVDVLNHHNIVKEDILEINRLGQYNEMDFPSDEALKHFEISLGSMSTPSMMQMFRRPFVLEATGGGFDKPPNTSFRTLRFPRSSRLHLDRTFESATSFDELQAMASAADSPPERESQEDRKWVEHLQRNGQSNQYIIDNSQSSSRRSSSVVASSELGLDGYSPITAPSTLVRMDSSELRPNEIRCSDGHVRGGDKFKQGPLSSSPSKRKRSSRESPFEGLHPTKRIRPSPPGTQRHQETVRTSHVPEFSHPAPQLSGPLGEIRNVSPTRTRCRQSMLTPTATQRHSKAYGEKRSTHVESGVASRADQETSDRVCKEQKPLKGKELASNVLLPTPPLSSPEEGRSEVCARKTLEPKQQCSARYEIRQAGMSMSSNTESSSLGFPSENRNMLIHVGDKLHRVSRRHKFHQLVRNVNTSLIYSCKYFLQRIACLASFAIDSRPVVSVLLVRAAQANETATAIDEIKEAMKEIGQPEIFERPITILLMDWRYLGVFQENEDTNIIDCKKQESFIEACFAGSVKWSQHTVPEVSDDTLAYTSNSTTASNKSSHKTTKQYGIWVNFEREKSREELNTLKPFTSPS